MLDLCSEGTSLHDQYEPVQAPGRDAIQNPRWGNGREGGLQGHGGQRHEQNCFPTTHGTTFKGTGSGALRIYHDIEVA